MFLSLLAGHFLSSINNVIHSAKESKPIPSTVNIMKDIMVIYDVSGKRVMWILYYKSEMGSEVESSMKLDQLLKG